MKLKISFLAFFLMLYAWMSQAQNATLGTVSIAKDWDIFKNIQLQMNPSTYQYHSKKQIDSLIKWADSKIATTDNIVDFYKILSSFSSYQGSAYNYLNLPTSFFNSLSEDQSFFPIVLNWNGERVFVNSVNESLQIGSEIHAINGKKIAEILKDISKYYSADGYIYTPKSTGINSAFDLYYWLEYGSTNQFSITYSKPLSKEIASINLKGVSYSASSKLFKKRHSKSLDDNFYQTNITPKIKWEVIQDNTCILTINSLHFGDTYKDPEQLGFRMEVDSFFSYLSLHPQFSNLIIDVRKLKEGDEMSASQILQYLSDQQYPIVKEEFTITQKILYPTLLNVKKNENEDSKKEFALDWEDDISEIYTKKRNGKFFTNNKSSTKVIPAHQSKIFKGKVYLLISNSVEKIGTPFASLVQEKTNCLLIGEETIAAYDQSNYKNPISYTLPNTKITFQFALTHTNFAIKSKDKYYYGRGLIPTIEVRQSALDFIENRDAIMEYTIRKINKDAQ